MTALSCGLSASIRPIPASTSSAGLVCPERTSSACAVASMRARSVIARARLVNAGFPPTGSFPGWPYSAPVEREGLRVVEELIDAWNRRDRSAALKRLHPECELHPVEA